MTREDRYKKQLIDLEIYEPAFDAEISTLAQLEREAQRAKKEWSATAAPGAKPSFDDPLYALLTSLRREILVHREALGLTPKSLRRIKGSFGEVVHVGEMVDEPDLERGTVLELVKEKYAL